MLWPIPKDSKALNIIIEKVAESKSATYNRKRAGTMAGDIAAEDVIGILREREGMQLVWDGGIGTYPTTGEVLFEFKRGVLDGWMGCIVEYLDEED